MPRHARIDNIGLLQHVIFRGIERKDIFLGNEDREDFIARLDHLLEETRTICYAWAMLNNHVHLLLMPTERPLSHFMRRLLTGYAVSFNVRHRRSGHLFQNRYKSIVCDQDSYLMELVRYIHLNPVRAKIIDSLDELASYRWCGHRQLIGLGSEQLIAADDLYALLGPRKRAARQSYLNFLADGLKLKIGKLSIGGRRSSQLLDDSLTDHDAYDDRILGGGHFVERVLKELEQDERLMSLDEIVTAVSAYFGISELDLSQPSKVRSVVKAKAVVCYLAIRVNKHTGGEVGRRLSYTSSATSRAIKRGQELCDEDEKLKDLTV